MASTVTRDHHNLRRNLKLNGNYISNDGGDEGIRIDDDGKIGIGTDGPDAPLDIKADVVDFIHFDRTANGGVSNVYKISVGASDMMGIGRDGSEDLFITSSGNVGLGTPHANKKMTISGADASGDLGLVTLDANNTITSGVELGRISFGGDDPTDNTFQYGAAIAAEAEGAWDTNDVPAKLVFYTADDGTNTLDARMTILENGNVGIGEAAPQDTLEVNGTVLVKDALKFTQDDGNEFIDSQSDGYLDIGATTAIRLEQDTLIEGTKRLYFNDTGGEYISGDGTDLTIASGGDLTLEVGVNSLNIAEWGGGGIELTVGTGDIVFKPSGNDVSYFSGETETINFDCGSSGTTHVQLNSILDTGDYCKLSTTTHGATTLATVDDDNAEAAHLTFDIQGDTIFKGDIADGTSTEVMRIDSASSGVKVANTVYFAAETATAVGHLATGTIDWNVSQKQKLTITGTGITIQFTDPAGPCNLLLKVVQGDGSDVIGTWDGDIKWAGGEAPTLSTGNGEIDILSFYWDGTNYFGVASLDFATP